jgi:hypothetical protein
MSKREAALPIISIAQQANPNVKGQRLFRRAQLTSSSKRATTMGEPAPPSEGELESWAAISTVVRCITCSLARDSDCAMDIVLNFTIGIAKQGV